MLLGTAFSNSVCGIGLGIYAGGLVVEVARQKHFDWELFPYRPLFLLLIVSLIISTLISRHAWVSLNGLGKYLQSFLIVFAAMDILRCSGKHKVAWVVLTGAFLLAVLAGLSQKLFGVDFLRGHEAMQHFEDNSVMRLTGSFKHPNDYGTFLICGFPFGLAGLIMAWKVRRKYSVLFWALLLTGLTYTLITTLSRGAIFSSFVAIFVFAMAFRFRWKVLGILTIGLALLWFVPSILQDRLHELVLFRGSSSERMLLIQTSLRMIEAGPVFGLGLNTYSDNFPLFRPPDYKAYMYAHNSFLQIATEAGLLGLFLYLALILSLLGHSIRAFFKNETNDQTFMFGFALIAGIIGFLVNCLFESSLQSTQLRTLFWALLGITFAMATYGTRPRKIK